MTDREPVIIEKACWERGCACYDHRVDEGVEVTLVQREWQPLTAAERIDIVNGAIGLMDAISYAEAKLKEKNT